MDLPGLWISGEGHPDLRAGRSVSQTWEWSPREDPALGYQWIPRHSAGDLRVDIRSGSGAGGRGTIGSPAWGDCGR